LLLELAASLVGVLQAPATTTVVAGSIVYEPVGCMVAGQFPLIDAVIEPAASVTRARVYFKPAFGLSYFVEMTLQDGKFVGKLPKPTLEASPIIYYILAITTGDVESQTWEVEARVVSHASQCPEGVRVASIGPPGAVRVLRPPMGIDPPPAGFGPPSSPWVFSLQVGVPQKAFLTVGRVFAVERWCDDMCGVLVAVEPGVGGGKLSLGVSKGSGGASVVSRAAKITVLRTWKPWTAADRSTYLGVELAASLWSRPGLVANAGLLRRLSARSQSHNWIVTAGVGLGR